jgi:hypothetical protein
MTNRSHIIISIEVVKTRCHHPILHHRIHLSNLLDSALLIKLWLINEENTILLGIRSLKCGTRKTAAPSPWEGLDKSGCSHLFFDIGSDDDHSCQQ